MIENCGIVDPPEGDRREHGRHDPRQQDDGAQDALEGEVVVEQQREPEPEPELSDRRDRRVEHAVEDRLPEQPVADQELEILEPDPLPAPADRGVGERQPDAEAERIGEEREQQAGRRQHANEDEERLPVEQAHEPIGLGADGRPSGDGRGGQGDTSLRSGGCGASRAPAAGCALCISGSNVWSAARPPWPPPPVSPGRRPRRRTSAP